MAVAACCTGGLLSRPYYQNTLRALYVLLADMSILLAQLSQARQSQEWLSGKRVTASVGEAAVTCQDGDGQLISSDSTHATCTPVCVTSDVPCSHLHLAGYARTMQETDCTRP